MKLKFYLLTFTLIIYSSLIFAQSNSIIEYTKESKGIAKIVFKLGNYKSTDVKTNQGIAKIYNIEDGTKIIKKGAPDLPKLSRSIIIPDQQDIKLKVVHQKYIEIPNVIIAPSKGTLIRNIDPNSVPFEFGEEYSQNRYYPNNLVDLGNPYILRDYRGQVVNINPFSYNPVEKLLRIYTELTIEIEDVPATKNSINILNRDKHKILTHEFNQIYKEHFLNYTSEEKYTPLDEEGEMLIISPNKYISALDTFVHWKKQRGMNVTVTEFSAIGTTSDELKSYVQEFYDANNLTYLLLIGDAEDIPSLTKTGDSDAAYGHILGDDSYTEVFVGRFSTDSIEDLQTQVNRTIYYERDIDESADWLSNAIVIASNEGTSGEGDDGESDIQHMDNIRADLLNYGYSTVDQVYDPGAIPSDVAEGVNEGRSVINYVGHGSDYSWATSGFSISDVNQLTNDNKLPYIFDVACVNGNFHGQTCFAESWLRATNNDNPTGAVAIIASTINQSWASPMDAQDEMIDILTESYENNIKRTFGGITMNGGMHMIDEYGSDGADMANTWTIFGDPSLLVRTKTPEIITASHNSVIYVGASNFTVEADDSCLVSLTLNNEIIAVGTTESGEVVLEFDALESTEPLKLTITGYNKVTYQSEISVIAPDSPYVIYSYHSINDDDENSNQFADYGESVKLNVELKNISEVYDAFNVKAKLITVDTNLILVDSIENYGDLLLSSDSLINNAFALDLKNRVQDQHKIKFSVLVSGEDSDTKLYDWKSDFNIKVNAPKLNIVGYFIDDEDQNSNEMLDPGEQVNLKLIIKNEGHSQLENIGGTIDYIGGSSYFELIDSVVEPFTLMSNQIDTLNFVVAVDENEVIDTFAIVKFALIDNNFEYYSVVDTEKVEVGKIPEFIISGQDSVKLSSDIAYFYDSGGEDETYSSDENYTVTFYPQKASGVVKVKFINFDVEEDNTSGGCYDYLSVYNGISTSDELMGEYCNENPPDEIIASNSQGALTFVFYSDGYEQNEGWKAEVTTESAYEVKFVVADHSGDIENAIVEFEDKELYTNINGEAIFAHIVKGENLEYTVSKMGYESISSVVNVTGNITEDVDLDFIGYVVTFNIKQGNIKLPNVTIDFNSEEKVTDSQGGAIFEGVMPNSLDYFISKEGYEDLMGNLQVESSDTTLNLQLSISTGLKKFDSDKLKIYPNPSSGIFTVEVNELNATKYQIQIFDITGSIILNKEIQSTEYLSEQIDLTDKSKGVYFLSIQSDDGFIINKRLIIK